MKPVISFALFSIALTATAAQPRYSLSMFERALKETSSPRFVLFQLRDPRAGSVEMVCTLGRSLVDAVQTEHDWNYSTGGRMKAKGMTLRHWNEPFAFEKVNAESKAAPHYSAQELNNARARLSRFNNRELRKQLHAAAHHRDSGELGQMYAGSGTPIGYGSRDAIAHVLLERGILVAADSRTGQLRLP